MSNEAGIKSFGVFSHRMKKDSKLFCFNIHALLIPNPVLRLQNHCSQ